ncbi:pentatricopeptide repeat-containing protein At2g29760, chloroplastic-like isoform X2 [Ziziphus jujuba]|uniref:Pentatricopeptide repeat-containing protein At2g29760, chloroplastic-like isoform X2 n=1 Tax=Ziziphus jujuba TaxID=326968 RepID=A0A6P6GE58_ZIZJJ|nr:pentatricopeptide repeat-containing protein At2g29760, chloroplastic-like isoform X2 [Ziziphus jujuba]
MYVARKCRTVGSRLKHSFHFHSLFVTLPSMPATLTHKFKTSTHQDLHCLLEKCSSMSELKQLHAQIIIRSLTNENLTLGKLISFCAVSDAGDLRYARLIFDQVCAGKSAYWDAVVVHGQAVKLGFGSQVCVQNALINVYVVCGLVQCAQKVFDDIPEKTLVSWNSMFGGYSRIGCCKEAFLLFRKMRELQLEPDKFTMVNLLSVCSHGCDLDLGRYVHHYIEVTGMEIDQIVKNSLLDMYVKCGSLHSAQTVFDRMSDKNVVSWTSICNAYAKSGLVEFAQEFFNKMPLKNVVSWNTMISCFVREGRFKEALDLFHKMLSTSVVPDEATLVCILSACSQIGDLVTGKETHKYISNSSIKPSITLLNSLMDMYAKCGALGIAMNLFLEIPEKNVVSWNVIIGALALHGCGPKAIGMFEEMKTDGIWPDEFTFTGLLSACSHSGLVDMGRYYFDRMTSVYSISPEIEHYACIIDLLGRGGHLEEAIRLIGEMPMKPDVVIWGALLGACRIHANVEIGKLILKQFLELEPHTSGLYVLLSNIFCEAQRWEDVKKIRKLMKDGGVIKTRAISFIEIDGCVHEFIVEDKRHVLSSYIYIMLDQLTDHLKSTGCSADLSNIFLDIPQM